MRWHRSAGATGYDLEIGSANRKHWKRLLTNWPGNSWYATNWQKDRSYRFIARAVNDGGSSEWVESALSVAPPCAVDSLSVVTSTPGEGDIGASGGEISASWNAGKRASAYNLDYNGSSVESGLTATSHSWSVGSRGASDSVSVQSVSGNMTSPSSSASVAWLTASSVKGTTATLDLAGHSGDWYVKRTAPTPAGSCESAGSGTTHSLSGLTASTTHTFTAYGDASCARAMATTTFTTTASLTVSKIRATSATLNIDGHSGQWWYDADTGPDATCQGPVTTSSDSLTGLTEHQQYTYTAYDAAGCGSGDALTSITFEPSGDVLTAESVTANSATLELSNHTGSWWFKRTAPDAGSCTAGESDFTNDLTGLSPVTEYTYKAYDVDGCADTHESASVTFTTGGVSVSNLAETVSSHEFGVGNVAGGNTLRATNFTTGSNSNSYTLHSVTAKFNAKSGSPAALVVEVYSKHDSESEPGSSKVTLSGSNPNTAGDYTYTCSGNGCDLSANTTYYLVLSAPGSPTNARYKWRLTQSTNQTNTPGNADWEIGNRMLSKESGGPWGDNVGFDIAGMIKVSATENPPATLTASGISGTGATLTIGGHTGDWFYKGISGTEASSNCQDVYNSTTDTLSSLTADKLYGYTAHDHASCSSATELAREYFSTNDFDVGNLGEGAASGSCLVGYSAGSRKCAMPFTTGDRSGGYTLKSITAEFNAKQEITGTLGNIIVAIHAEDTVNSANPAATAKVTLDGNNPNTAGLYSYTCSGSDCSLSKETKYFIVMSTADTDGVKFYQMKLTTSDAEAVHPSGNEWSIENVGREKNGSAAWVDLASSQTGLLHIAADD